MVIGRALQAERRLTSGNALRLAVLATVFLTVAAGAVQATVDTQDFKSFWEGVVGGRDGHHRRLRRYRPEDGWEGWPPGSLALLVVAAVLTATVASHFVQVDQGDDSQADS